jgi:hypothetical protein
MLSHEDEVTYHNNTARTYLVFAQGHSARGDYAAAQKNSANAARHFSEAAKFQALVATRPGSESVSNPLSQ